VQVAARTFDRLQSAAAAKRRVEFKSAREKVGSKFHKSLGLVRQHYHTERSNGCAVAFDAVMAFTISRDLDGRRWRWI
jgi:hypothetical protein